MMVEAVLNYLRPGGPINRRFVAPGAELNTGAFDEHRVSIADARAATPAPSLDLHGFALLPHASPVADYDDAAEIDAHYPKAACDLIRRVTGADLVAPMGWMLRSSAPNAEGVQPPASDVHVDVTPERAPRAAAHYLEQCGQVGFAYGRFIITSLWRAISPPPQDWPLALCDGRSVRDDEGHANVMIRVPSLPVGEALFAPIEGEETLPSASLFPRESAHRWFYYPNLTRDEALLLKFYDSRRAGAWRVPHTAFLDPSATASQPRRSIEFRSIAYFAA